LAHKKRLMPLRCDLCGSVTCADHQYYIEVQRCSLYNCIGLRPRNDVCAMLSLCLQGVGRITSYSSSQSSGGGAHGAGPHARSWGVLNAREKAALQQHTGCIELVESMLVGEPNWRPSADQVVVKAQRLLVAVLSNSNVL